MPTSYEIRQEQIERTRIDVADGGAVPITALAEIRYERGPNMIAREDVPMAMPTEATASAGPSFTVVVDHRHASVPGLELLDDADLVLGHEVGSHVVDADVGSRTVREHQEPPWSRGRTNGHDRPALPTRAMELPVERPDVVEEPRLADDERLAVETRPDALSPDRLERLDPVGRRGRRTRVGAPFVPGEHHGLGQWVLGVTLEGGGHGQQLSRCPLLAGRGHDIDHSRMTAAECPRLVERHDPDSSHGLEAHAALDEHPVARCGGDPADDRYGCRDH